VRSSCIVPAAGRTAGAGSQRAGGLIDTRQVPHGQCAGPRLRGAISRRPFSRNSSAAEGHVMKKTFVSSTLVLLLALLSVSLSAQRGGGGRGSGDSGAPGAPPTLLTGYDSAEYGMKFPAPPDLSVFTPAAPGQFRQVFTPGKVIYLVDLMGKPASVSVKYSPGVTDADLKGLKNTLDSNPPQAKLPGYKKISVAMIKIGARGDKDAVEYVFNSKEKDDTTTTRQVVFVHKGKGFTFGCVALEKDFASVDRKSFQPLFASIEFR
jgi:hypothetical protein